jgi:hypothetical protein
MIKVCPGREKEIILKKFTDRCFKCVKGIASGSYSFGPVAVLLMNITRCESLVLFAILLLSMLQCQSGRAMYQIIRLFNEQWLV